MKILFIHHGDHRGGAPLSMLYTMLEVRKRGYDPIAGLTIPTVELKALYGSYQIETIDMPWIKMIYFWSANPMQWWKLSTYLDIFNVLINQSKGKILTRQVIDDGGIDIVHLNSVSLFAIVPYLLKENIPFVWHIREHAPQRGSLIFNEIASLMKKTKNLIFLSEAEQYSWTGDKDCGTVVYNFVDQAKFNFNMDVKAVKKQLNLSENDRTILYLGGLKPHKGIEVLINTMSKLVIKYPDLKCIMPDSLPSQKRSGWKSIFNSLSGMSRFEQLMISKIEKSKLRDNCIMIPFDAEAQKFFAVCELVVFPALAPHFARPAIEAAIMKKPVIVSNWPVLLEIVKPNITGLTVLPNNEIDLYNKIDCLLSDQLLKEELGENAYQYACETFTANAQIGKIIKMYTSYLPN